jgi:TRAP-type transport system large permease protein
LTALVIAVFALFALLGMPLSFALGISSVTVLFLEKFELVVMAQRMLYAVDNFPLMAIPLFILAGEIMVKSEMMERLVSFSNSLIGKVHGGLAHVTIVSGMILAAVSGAAVACASALGRHSAFKCDDCLRAHGRQYRLSWGFVCFRNYSWAYPHDWVYVNCEFHFMEA